MVNKTIEYILGWVIALAVLYIFAKWAGYVVAKDDWLAFIAGFIVLWLVIYLAFGKKNN